MGELYSAASCLQGVTSPVGAPGSSAEGMQIHLHLFAAAQHPHGGVEPPRRNRHLPPTHQLPVPGEEHLQDHRGATVRVKTPQSTIPPFTVNPPMERWNN